MQDYISQFFSKYRTPKHEPASIEPKNEEKTYRKLSKKVKAKSEARKSMRTPVVHENAHSDAVKELKENVAAILHEYEVKVYEPAKNLGIAFTDQAADGDKVNGHIELVNDAYHALSELNARIDFLAGDPAMSEEDTLPSPEMQAPDMSSDVQIPDVEGELAAGGGEIPEAVDNAPVAEEPVIIDEWEFLAKDPEFNDNATLLYDKGTFVVFIQKDAEPSELPYYVAAILPGGESIEHDFGTIDEVCKWLQVENLPIPTDDAKDAINGLKGEAKEEKPEEGTVDAAQEKLSKELPKDLEATKDDQTISTVAPEVEDPKEGTTKELDKLAKENK